MTPTLNAEVGFPGSERQPEQNPGSFQISSHKDVIPSGPQMPVSPQPALSSSEATLVERAALAENQQPSFNEEAAEKPKENEGDDSRDQNKNEEFRKVSFFELFRFATTSDRFLIMIAVICSMANGGEKFLCFSKNQVFELLYEHPKNLQLF
jgi:hypothetical protein